MAIAAAAFLGLLAAFFVLAWRRRPLAPLVLWAFAWVALAAQRAGLELAGADPRWLAAALLAAALFPALQLAGARAWAGLLPWPWLVPGALAAGAVAAMAAWPLGTGPAFAGLAILHVALLSAAASQVGHGPDDPLEAVPVRALPLAFLALAAVGGVEGVLRALGAEPGMADAAWLAVAPACALCQVLAVTDRQRRADARRRREGEEAARRLAAVEERYRRVTELSSDFSYAVRVRPNRSWRLLWVTGAFTRLTGYTREEVEGGWLRMIEPEDREAARARYRAALAGADGEHGYRFRTKSGEVRWLSERLRAVPDGASGDVILYGAAHDNTERRRADEERERLQARLHESERLESMGRLARGVAHDFNQLLTPILGQVAAALEEVPPDSQLKGRLAAIRQAAGYAASLVEQMLTYAGQGDRAMERVDLSQVVEEMLPLLRSAVTSRTRLLTDLTPGMPPLRADPTQIRQVVLNLATNGAEALDGPGRVWVRTRQVHADARLLGRAVPTSPRGPGPFAVLEVEDEGVGMDARAREHLFDPFYTTKREGRGLGLATVLGIVRRHEGAILVDSEPGRGSCIRILLPLADAGEVALGAGGSGEPAGAARSVLLVDDDEGVAEVAGEFLRRAGFRVRVAPGGKEGLEAFCAAPAAYDAVVLDWTMPEVDGATLLLEIRRLAPELPVVVISGFDDPELLERREGAPLAAVRKPFAPETLVGALRQVLGASTAQARPPGGEAPSPQ